MVTPSNKYSDIGDFTPGESGWWFGKPTADHVGLRQKLTDLGVDIIHRGTSAELSNFTPQSGAAFYAEDTEVLHLGDGTAWNAQATWGANPTFTSVDTERISNVYDHVIGTSEDLATALDDAEANQGITIKIGPGQFTPFQYKGDTTPWSLKGGTTIVGSPQGDSAAEIDSFKATSGSVIDAGGNTLFKSNDVTGISLNDFGVTNYQVVFECGEPLGYDGAGTFELGITQSTFKNLAFWNGSDYALKLRNFQRLRLDKIVQSDGPGLVHAIGSTDNFQPGNSVWIDLHSTPNQNSIPAFHIEARDVSINYITLIRPQVINGVGDGTGTAFFIEGSSGSVVSNGIDLISPDLEGYYDTMLKYRYGVQSQVVAYHHNDEAGSYALDIGADSLNVNVHMAKAGDVLCSTTQSEITGKVRTLDGNYGFGTMNQVNQSERVTQYFGLTFPSKRVAYDDDYVRFLGRHMECENGYYTEEKDLSTHTPSVSEPILHYHNGNDGNPKGYYFWDMVNTQWNEQGGSTTIVPA